MASTHTLTGNVFDLAGVPLVGASNIGVRVVTNLGPTEALVDKTTNRIHLGGKPATVDLSGNFTVTLIDTSATDLNVVANTLEYQVEATYTDKAAPGLNGRKTWLSGWFPLTTNANLADITTDVSPMAVQSASAFAAAAAESAAAAQEIVLGDAAAVLAGAIVNPGPVKDNIYASSVAIGTDPSKPVVQFNDTRYVPRRSALAALTAPWFIAHRGGAGVFPEETMAAYRAAASAGAHALEMDVQPVSDGALVCMHDSTVDRTTNATGAVSSFGLPSILTLDAAAKFPWNGRAEPLALYTQVLDEFGSTIPLVVEPKDGATLTRCLDEATKRGLQGSVLFQVVTVPLLSQVLAAEHEAMMLYGVGFAGAPDVATVKALGVKYAGISSSSTDADIQTCAANLITSPYTVVRRTEWVRLAALGCQSAFVDQPYYIGSNTAVQKVDSWRRGVLGFGFNYSTFLEGASMINAGALVMSGGGGRAACIGEVSPIANAASTYTLSIQMGHDTLPANTFNGTGVALYADDARYDRVSSFGNGYRINFRANGTIAVYKDAKGSAAGPSLGTQATAAMTAGQLATLTVAVTPTTLTITRTDSGGFTPLVITDSTYRGGYVHVGKDDGVARFKNLTITP